MPDSAKPPRQTISDISASSSNPPCPYCGDRHTVSNGYRDTRTLGRRRRLVCRSCGRKFSTGQAGAATLREEIDELRRRVETLESRA